MMMKSNYYELANPHNIGLFNYKEAFDFYKQID